MVFFLPFDIQHQHTPCPCWFFILDVPGILYLVQGILYQQQYCSVAVSVGNTSQLFAKLWTQGTHRVLPSPATAPRTTLLLTMYMRTSIFSNKEVTFAADMVDENMVEPPDKSFNNTRSLVPETFQAHCGGLRLVRQDRNTRYLILHHRPREICLRLPAPKPTSLVPDTHFLRHADYCCVHADEGFSVDVTQSGLGSEAKSFQFYFVETCWTDLSQKDSPGYAMPGSVFLFFFLGRVGRKQRWRFFSATI